MSPTVKNKQLINMYRKFVDLLYYEREISNTVGSFIVREEKTSSGSLKSSEGHAENNNTKLTSTQQRYSVYLVFRCSARKNRGKSFPNKCHRNE